MKKITTPPIKNDIEKKEKPFRLVKYFTFSSLIVTFLATLVLSALNTHLARSMQREKSEEYARVLVENLNHQVFMQFVIPVAIKFGKIQLRNKDQFERMDKVVRSTFHSFEIKTVNIYDLDDTISYSYDQKVIGMQKVGGTGYLSALEGNSNSKLRQRGNSIQMLLGFPKESLLVTYAPLRAERPLSRLSGPVLGVVEIVQDLSKDYLAIFRFQIIVVSTISTVMCVIFLILLLIVKKGEGIIQQKAVERLRLEEKLNRAKHLSSLGEMTAGISHEIRNPLGIIQSSAELLKKKISDPSNKIPDIIIEESTRLNNIITDFLNYAKPREPNRIPCDVTDIIDKILTYLEPGLQAQTYVIRKYFGDSLPQIMADGDMLYQAFLNILMNAMQAMPNGGEISIEVNIAGNNINLIFEDEGPGIPDGNLEKIWEPFFTTKDTGTGLGLGIVKNIIESHSGSIRISNNHPLKGARVTVELPIYQEGK
ncbi:MAG: two-component sensor histidine kinase [Proteobacteria bacterium]|nr:two-component sensor histidine kinase [Pseudomonadota bacterium]